MAYALWFGLGLVAVLPLLLFAQRLKLATMGKLMGRSLLVAAVIYIGFALVWGSPVWVLIEGLGVAAYGAFYLLSMGRSVLWIALGWLLHPVWDVAVHLLGPGAHIAPAWYAVACLSFDLAVAGYIAYRVADARRVPC